MKVKLEQNSSLIATKKKYFDTFGYNQFGLAYDQ